MEFIGRFGNPVVVDYLVTGTSHSSAVLALTSSTQGGAHAAANEIFRRWYDLRDTPQWKNQAVTVFDDRRVGLFRDEELERLKDLSEVIAFSERTTLVAALAA